MADFQQSGVAVLAVHQCWALLRSAQVGRLAVFADEYPDIFPVNYVLDRGTVVFRTGKARKLAAVTARPQVAFEVDGYDTDADEAWSVVIKGRAGQIDDLYEALDALVLPLFPWHAEPKHNFVRIVPADITGRQFHIVDPTRWHTPMTGTRRAASE